MAELQTFFTAPDKRALVLPGAPADYGYTFTVRAYRRVDSDIEPTGFILSDPVTTALYTPVTVPAFAGDITGTIQGRNSLDVVVNLENIASDAILSTTEKPAIILTYNQTVSDWQSLDAKATEVGGFPTEQDAATAAKNALDAYLDSLVPAWDDTTQHTPIDKVTFQNKWAAFYAALADLRAAITGRPGADAVTIIVSSDRQTITYDNTGAPSPTVQTTTFTAQKQNNTAAVTWTVKDATGAAMVPTATYLSAATGDTVTMTEAQFEAAANGSNGVIVTGSITVGGITITDSISVARVQNGQTGDPGAPGPAGATIGLTLSDGTFDYIDGVPFNSAQSITITATKQNTTEAIDWTTVPVVTLTGAGDVRTLSIANFGANQSVVITATGHVSGAKASVTINRNAQTTPNDSIIPDTGWVGTGGAGGIAGGTPWKTISGSLRLDSR